MTASGDRPWSGALPAVLTATLLVVGAVWAANADPGGEGSGRPRVGNALVTDWAARGEGQQVLAGIREPGLPTIQRQRHDSVVFTISVAPARPGPNLVRVDVTRLSGPQHAHADRPIRVGTANDDAGGTLAPASPRPGTDGSWAVVDLPEGTGTVLVSHGRWHRIPFAVDTGSREEAGGREVTSTTWTGPDGPECLAAATASILAGGTVVGGRPAPACPGTALSTTDRSSLLASVDLLLARGVQQLAVQHDASPRSAAATAAVEEVAAAAGVTVVRPEEAPGPRSALLVLGGWEDAAQRLSAATAVPLDAQPIRSDGTWLAPWLLTPGVVDSTPGAVVPLDFDIRSAEAQRYSQTLGKVLQGQAPTASGYAAWRTARGIGPGPVHLYAASRAAYMPATAGHGSHETEISWFPGGTVTPVASLSVD